MKVFAVLDDSIGFEGVLDSLWFNEREAQAHAASLNGRYIVEACEVEGNTRTPESITEVVIERLRGERYDAFRKGSYHDISDRVRQVILEELRAPQPCPSTETVPGD